jgi:hypothetical protein
VAEHEKAVGRRRPDADALRAQAEPAELREQSPQGGDGLAADRNRQAEGRDQAAQGRDRRAETRDRAAERRDRTAGERDADAEARDRRFRDRARQAHEREDQVEAWQARAEARDRAAEARDRAAEARDRQAEAPVAEELGLMEVLARAARDRAAATRDRIAAAEDRVAAAQDRVRWTRTVAQAAVEQAQAALAEARRPRTAPRRWRTAPRPKMTGGGLAATEPGRPMPAIRWLVRKNADGAGGSLPVVSSRPRSHVSVNRPSSNPFAVRYRRARSQHATPHAPLGYERGKAMAPSPNWEAQLDQLSTHRLSRLVRHTGLFVQRVRERWQLASSSHPSAP